MVLWLISVSGASLHGDAHHGQPNPPSVVSRNSGAPKETPEAGPDNEALRDEAGGSNTGPFFVYDPEYPPAFLRILTPEYPLIRHIPE